MSDPSFDLSSNEGRWPGIIVVVLLHAAALWSLWQYKIIPPPQEMASTLFVSFIAPPAPKVEAPPRRPPSKPRPVEKPRVPHHPLAVNAPVVSPTEFAVPAAPPEVPAPAAPSASSAPPMPLAYPVTLGAELSVVCPERTPPAYPPFSRRWGETGIVVLRVELDEQGRVASALVKSSSGHARLDEAALTAVKTWRCNPAQRNGQPVRAIALQPFNFILQGS